MTGVDDEAFALEAVRHGIQDYLVKGQADARQTARAIRYAIERKRMEVELQRERDQLEERVRERTAELSATNRDLQSEIARRQKAEEAKKQILRRLKDSEETERARISRELHDRLEPGTHGPETGDRIPAKTMSLLVGQNPASRLGAGRSRSGVPCPRAAGPPGEGSYGSELGLAALQAQCPFAQNARNCLGKLAVLTTSLMQEVHRLAWELHPAMLDDLGLDTALRRFVTDWSENSGVPVDFHSVGLDKHRLPLELETTLYRVTQEALTNVARHANARRVSLLLERRPGHVSLIVEDDGAGFDVPAALHSFADQGQIGLAGNAGTRHSGRRHAGNRIHAGHRHHGFCARPAGMRRRRRVKNHEKASYPAGRRSQDRPRRFAAVD